MPISSARQLCIASSGGNELRLNKWRAEYFCDRFAGSI